MTTGVDALSTATSMAGAVQLLLRRRHSGAPAVDKGGRVMRLITGRDLLRALDAMEAKPESHKRSDRYELIETRHRELD